MPVLKRPQGSFLKTWINYGDPDMTFKTKQKKYLYRMKHQNDLL